MDNETVLMLYGDHGMTSDGNHGGESPNEVRTVFFAYTKAGFPMLKDRSVVSKAEQMKALDDMLLQDVASTASVILGLPLPFSSLGFQNPLLFLDPIVELPASMLANLAQIERYVQEYCATEAGIAWCD